MKNFTQFLTLGMFAASAMTVAAQATFEHSDAEFLTTHRTSAYAADLTNNGHLDIIYGGQGNNKFSDPVGWWWQIQQNLYLNNGNGSFSFDGLGAEAYEGVDDDGNPISGYNRVFAQHGILPSSFNQYAGIDFNNDGLIDLLSFGRYEWDIFCNDDEKALYPHLLLYKNLGGGRFELVTEAAFPKMQPDNNSVNYAIAVGDYDRDGYVDFAVTATEIEREENYPGRTVSLYRNLGGTGAFQDMKIAETKGGVWTKEVKDDADNIVVEKKLLEGYFLPMSGDVHLVDVDNDGWLDLVSTGWADNNWDGVHAGGNAIKIYLNKGGEKFVDVTPDSPALIALRSSASCFADFDNDGYLDMFQTGWGDNGVNWAANLIYNTTDTTAIFEDVQPCDQLGLDGTEGCRQIVRDFDGDGILDIYYSGANGCHFYYGNVTGSFTKSDESIVSYSSGFAAVGDVNGNGLSDLFVVGYTNDGAYAGLWLNTSGDAEAPAAPAEVKGTIEDGVLTITWDYDTQAAADENVVYNVYVKKADGSVYSLVPANPENGFVKVSVGREVALRPNQLSYTMPAPDGDCTVGVQAICLKNETYSAFTSAKVSESGIANIAVDSEAPVQYFNAQGIRIAEPTRGQIVIKVQGGVATKTIF